MIRRQLLLAILGLFACGDSRAGETRASVELDVPPASVSASTSPVRDSPGSSVASGRTSIVNPLASLAHSTYDDTAAVRQRVDSIIAIARARPDRLRLFARESEGAALVAVKDSLSWPDDVETSISMLYDDDGNIMLHTEIPRSESGDWYMVSEHFLNSQGHTVFHRAHVSGFGSECAQVVRETVDTFFSPKTGSQVARAVRITDGDGHPIRDVSACFLRIGSVPGPKRSLSQLSRP